MAADPILGIIYLDNSQVNHNVTVNEAIDDIAQAANAVLAVSALGGDVSLSPDQFTRHVVFQVTGHSAARDLTVPASLRAFVVHNLGSGAGVLSVVRGTTSIDLAVGASPAWFYTDATTNGLYKIG